MKVNRVWRLLLSFAFLPAVVADDRVSVLIASIGGELVSVIFTNNSEEPKMFLKPLDGSTLGWFQPRYEFTVRGRFGRMNEVKILDCIPYGLWSGPEWPKDYLIRLDPGQSEEIEVHVPHLRDAKGKLHVELKYEYDATEATPLDGVPYPSDLWEGSINSNAITIKR